MNFCLCVISVLLLGLPVFVRISQSEAFASDRVCFFRDTQGIFRSVPTLDEVPEEFRSSARCSTISTGNPLSTSPALTPPPSQPEGFTVEDWGEMTEQPLPGTVRPDTVELTGNIRRTRLITPLGEVQLRWPRSVENYFGKNPDRAVRDAWGAATRVLSRTSFPQRLRSAQYRWNVVFMDETPAGIGPRLGGCHPAWMRPPADIFISASQIATHCSSVRKGEVEANAFLARALVHELGHAIEFQLAERGFPYVERWHSEGFATWFEVQAGGAYIGREKIFSRPMLREQAKQVLTPNWRREHFRGSPEDYIRSYALISAIADGLSVSRLVEVYKRMATDQIPLQEAVRRELGWDEKQWVAEALKFLHAKGK